MIKKIIKRIYFFIKRIKVNIKLDKILITHKEKTIFLIGSPLHGNIGDHAISIAEMKFLKDHKKNKIIEIPGEYYKLCHKKIKKNVKDDDIIIITGGGFIGSLWINEENMVRHIVGNFENNKIIIMPQTVFFEDSEKGKKEFEISKKIYEKHSNLYLCVREENTLKYCQENLKGIKNIILVPDIVTYLDYQMPKENREGILFCLRNDKEKAISTDVMDNLLQFFRKMDLKVKHTTTVIKRRISFETREEVFEKKILEFKKSELVITDRLHGMIFAAITATPCIAMNNVSGKVKGVYRWLDKLDYITFVESVSDIESHIKKLMNMKDNYYTQEIFKESLSKILDFI